RAWASRRSAYSPGDGVGRPSRRTRVPRGPRAPLALRNGLQPVPVAVARLDERVVRSAAVDLVAQAAHEDVHRSVAMRFAPSPELLQQLVACDDSAAVDRELIEQSEFGRCQLGALSV